MKEVDESRELGGPRGGAEGIEASRKRFRARPSLDFREWSSTLSQGKRTSDIPLATQGFFLAVGVCVFVNHSHESEMAHLVLRRLSPDDRDHCLAFVSVPTSVARVLVLRARGPLAP